MSWAWGLVGGTQQTAAVQTVTSNSIAYIFYPTAVDGSTGPGVNYQLLLAPGAGSCQQLASGDIRLTPNSSGSLVLILP